MERTRKKVMKSLTVITSGNIEMSCVWHPSHRHVLHNVYVHFTCILMLSTCA